MKKQTTLTLLTITLLLATTLLIAQEWPSFNVCCERTDSDAWCQNSPQENCNQDYRTTPTSCEATSFCKLGCCVDSDEGICMKNTPQKVCEVSVGTWLEDEQCNVPQCSLGCCLLGNEASFVTLTRCKRLSSIYGLETNFKSDVTSEATCVDLAFSQDEGACVYEVEFQRTCKFTTRGECLGSADQTEEVDSTFFKDFLCSADELATDCGPTKETMCLPGRDGVYFMDSCGNPANIYDAERTYDKDPVYWKKVVPISESCGYRSANGNINSKSCGNCEYLQGSLCGKGGATYGDLTCKGLNCKNTENGYSYRNGESWCMYQGVIDNGDDVVGSRHYRHVCIHGEEVVEPCADFRNEICIEEEMDTRNGAFIEAACGINRWDDCLTQYDEEDCLNLDQRECFWISGAHYDGSGEVGQRTGGSLANEDLEGENKGILNGGEICLPNNPPGLSFWDSEEASSVCSLGNSQQIVHFNTDLFGTKECEENCEVLEAAWVQKMNHVCRSLGDCGSYINIAGKYTNDGAVWKSNGQRKVLDGILGGLKDASGVDEVMKDIENTIDEEQENTFG